MNKSSPIRQQGATLVIALIMLVMITLFAVTMVRLSNTSMQVVGNMQTQRSLEASAQHAIENKISTIDFFNDAVDNVNQFATATFVDETPTSPLVTPTSSVVTVRIQKPVCVAQREATGYSLGSPLTPQDNVFEVKATSTDSVTNASVELVQGFKIRMTAGSCN